MACSVLLLASAGAASAQTLATRVETRRDYDLIEMDGQPPQRPLRFYIGENSAFAVCGRCLCATGIMTARYPQLGIRPTSASPTLACDRVSEEFDLDGEMIGSFLQMVRAEVDGEILMVESEDGHQMSFRLDGADLSPP